MKLKEKMELRIEFPYYEDNEAGTEKIRMQLAEEKENKYSHLLVYIPWFIIKINVKTFLFSICL